MNSHARYVGRTSEDFDDLPTPVNWVNPQHGLMIANARYWVDTLGHGASHIVAVFTGGISERICEYDLPPQQTKKAGNRAQLG